MLILINGLNISLIFFISSSLVAKDLALKMNKWETQSSDSDLTYCNISAN